MLIATDLDGTLLTPDGTISPRTRDAIRVAGTIENNSGKSLPLKRLQMIIYSKEGKKLHQWSYKPPRDSMRTGTKLQFASAVGNFVGYPERVEVKFSDGT